MQKSGPLDDHGILYKQVISPLTAAPGFQGLGAQPDGTPNRWESGKSGGVSRAPNSSAWTEARKGRFKGFPCPGHKGYCVLHLLWRIWLRSTVQIAQATGASPRAHRLLRAAEPLTHALERRRALAEGLTSPVDLPFIVLLGKDPHGS